MTGDFERVIELYVDDPAYLTLLSLHALGRSEDAKSLCHEARERSSANEGLMLLTDGLAALFGGSREAGLAAMARLASLRTFSDPEGLFYWAQIVVGLGDPDRALDLLSRAVDTGLHSVRGFETSPLLSAVRPHPAFHAILERARLRQAAAARAFADADGPRLLVLPFDAH